MSARRPVDLGRVRAAIDEIRATVREHPDIAARTGRFLAADLPTLPDQERLTMARTSPPLARLTDELYRRARRLRPYLRRLPELATMERISVAFTIRLALLRGLEQLEAQAMTAEERATWPPDTDADPDE